MRYYLYWLFRRLFICPNGWCYGLIDSDEHGVFFRCSACGRVTR